MHLQDFRVEMIGHATLRAHCNGRTLLTDPWLIDPIVLNSTFHFPRLVHDPKQLAAGTDAIYISHVHPDHLHPPSLDLFSRTTPIFIGEHRKKGFRDSLRSLGFPVVELPFNREAAVPGTDFRITIIDHDFEESAAHDSAMLLRTPEFSLFNNNDCVLHAAKYEWIRRRGSIDYAFLGYSPASFFPICFELDAREKDALLTASVEHRYDRFVEAALTLRPGLTVPFASGLRFLETRALWKNAAFSSAPEAARRLTALGLRAEVMGPGDRLRTDGSIERVSPILEGDAETTAIAAYARQIEGWVAELTQREPAPQPDLVDRFRRYVLQRWEQTCERLPGIRSHVIAYVLSGAQEHRFYFDFSKPPENVFHWGDPESYDMRYTYDAAALQQKLDGQIDWDELHFTATSVHQVRYARDFYIMLRSETLDLDRCV